LVLLTPQAPTQPLDTADAVVALTAGTPVTTLASFMGEAAVEPARRSLARGGIPGFRYPERAVEALAGMYLQRRLAERSIVTAEPVAADRAAVRRILDEACASKRPFVLEQHAVEIARAYGIPVPSSGLARERRDARRLAAEVGYPVALKLASPDVLHKTDIGGIALGIADEAALDKAWESVVGRARSRLPDAEVWGALVQKMVPPGRELIIGIERDPTFGPLLMFGIGGVYVEIMHDVAFRLCPLSHDHAVGVMQAIRGYGLLRGVRGQSPADLDAIADVIVRVSALAADFPEIVELDINPLIAAERGQGAVAADIRIGIGG
jgi:acyl-CoA synthetase (NDP forming)